jgi:hypothetical protein
MQAEIDAIETDRPVHIIGLNDVGHESGNAAITPGRSIPWLQPEPGQDIWTQWGVAYRDVVILGPDNERVAVYNLTEHDLADPANYAALRELLLSAAAE